MYVDFLMYTIVLYVMTRYRGHPKKIKKGRPAAADMSDISIIRIMVGLTILLIFRNKLLLDYNF